MSTSLLLDNRFDVHEPVGQGGMGVVFLGHDRQTGRRVAIKTLRADVVEWQPSALERFQREAELLRQLNHPNFVQVFAIVEQDGDTYIVMEYVEGGSLAARLRRDHPLPLGTVLSIALDVADAMTRVHRLDILHRDLKPENVLLAADGSARLSDFGIAHLKGGNALTQAGGVVGTPHYLSPEAVTGQSLDARSDVWAFGVELGLQVRTAGAPMNLKGYGHPDVGAGFTRAHETRGR